MGSWLGARGESGCFACLSNMSLKKGIRNGLQWGTVLIGGQRGGIVGGGGMIDVLYIMVILFMVGFYIPVHIGYGSRYQQGLIGMKIF